MRQLFEKTNAEVKKATAIIGKMQSPQYMPSPTWTDWEDVILKVSVVQAETTVDHESVTQSDT
jgi:hypothetical protein